MQVFTFSITFQSLAFFKWLACREVFSNEIGQHCGVTEDLSREESVHPALPRSGLLANLAVGGSTSEWHVIRSP
jgi:hypothetical protein